MEKELIQKAIEATKNSYSPYSKFKVGAAILMKDGKTIIGVNVENVSYGLTNCAERSAIFSMISQGYKKEDCVMMAIVANTDKPVSPCGACRQVMSEMLPLDCKIILANIKGDYTIYRNEQLLPYAFKEVENV